MEHEDVAGLHGWRMDIVKGITGGIKTLQACNKLHKDVAGNRLHKDVAGMQ